MIINKSFSYWRVDGNQNLKFGYRDDQEHRQRKPDEETLEEEFLRIFPTMWEKVEHPYQASNGSHRSKLLG